MHISMSHSDKVAHTGVGIPRLVGKCDEKHPKKLGDCHTRKAGWFAMTCFLTVCNAAEKSAAFVSVGVGVCVLRTGMGAVRVLEAFPRDR